MQKIFNSLINTIISAILTFVPLVSEKLSRYSNLSDQVQCENKEVLNCARPCDGGDCIKPKSVGPL